MKSIMKSTWKFLRLLRSAWAVSGLSWLNFFFLIQLWQYASCAVILFSGGYVSIFIIKSLASSEMSVQTGPILSVAKDLTVESELGFFYGSHDVLISLAIERRRSTQQNVKNHATTPNIAFFVIVFH